MTEDTFEESAPTIQVPTRRRRSWRGFGVLLVLLIGIFIGRNSFVIDRLTGIDVAEDPAAVLEYVNVVDGERQLVFPTFWETWDAIHAKYDGDVSDEDLFYGAVAGMVRAVGDPYTAFLPPRDTKQFKETIGGSFSGIGIEIGIRNNVPTVIAPLEGSPAQQAGMLAADIITAVDGENITQDMTLDDIVQRIRGERGTEVVLTVLHEGAADTEDITIVRDTIKIESVRTAYEDDVARITITNFNGDTAKRFMTAAREVEQAGSRGVIIDVRNNPGGFLDAAVDIASVFLPQGTLVVSEQGGEDKEYVAKGSTILNDIPIVVVVNQGSASASEILAGALQEQIGATIVGQQTFGKGSVQEFVELEDGSSLRVTVARWYTPEGRNIGEEGIAPDIEIEQDRETDEDEQLDRAREELQNLLAQ